MTKPKPRMGRPPLPKGEARNRYLRVRLTPDEERRVEARAKRDGVPVSEWARKRLLDE